MELELVREKTEYYEKILKTQIECEETAEMIVPDSMPDIRSIISTDGIVTIRDKEVFEGKTQVSGAVKTSVLYIPESQDGICRLNMNIPFSCEIEAQGLNTHSDIIIGATLSNADSRILNPRKLLGRVNISLSVTGYSKTELEFTAGVDNSNDTNVEILKESYNVSMVSDVKEKTFTVMDEIHIPTSKPAAEDILRYEVNVSVEEVKLIGKKAIFKGSALITILYLGKDGKMYTSAFQLPYSQIIEINNSEGEAEGFVKVFLTGADVELLEGISDGGRIMTVTLYLAAQAWAMKTQTVDVVSDMYGIGSTRFNLERSLYSLPMVIDRSEKRQNVRENIEISEDVAAVLDSYLRIGHVSQKKEENQVTFSVDGVITVVYQDASGRISGINKNIKITQSIEAVDKCIYDAEIKMPDDIYAGLASGGIDVKFSMDFDITTIIEHDIGVVSEVNMLEVAEVSEQPSIIMAFMNEKDSLWNIGKKYNAAIEDILEANSMSEEDTIAAGKLLLIPKKR